MGPILKLSVLQHLGCQQLLPYLRFSQCLQNAEYYAGLWSTMVTEDHRPYTENHR